MTRESLPLEDARADELLDLATWAQRAATFGPEDFQKLARLGSLASDMLGRYDALRRYRLRVEGVMSE